MRKRVFLAMLMIAAIVLTTSCSLIVKDSAVDALTGKHNAWRKVAPSPAMRATTGRAARLANCSANDCASAPRK